MSEVKFYPETRYDKTKPVILDGVPVLNEKGKPTFERIEKNLPIILKYSFNKNQRFEYYTGFRIDRNNFNEGYYKKTKADPIKTKAPDSEYINENLKILKTHVQNIETNAKRDGITLTTEYFRTELNKLVKPQPEPVPETSNFFATFDKYIEVAKFSHERKRHVSSIMNQWRRYEVKRKITITFDSVTVDLLRDFEKFLRKEDKRPKRWNSKKLVISPKGENTIHKIMAMSRAFWNFAKNDLKQNGIVINYPFGKDGYQVPGDVYGAPVYITKEERNILFNAQLDSERLQRVRDIFVFQCLIGARVGDLCKLTKANVQNGILTYIPRKTKDGKPVAVTVPLSKNAIEILSRYDMPDETLLPFITDQRYNTYLKELFREVKINRTVTRLNPTTGEPEQVKLCDIVSSHMARRAFIGNLYGKVDSGIISSMSGHIQGSKAFTRYYDVSTELQQQAINLID